MGGMGAGEMILGGLYLVVSLILIGLGVPFLMDKVPPNSWYGFRTPRTLNDPGAWYRANRACGLWCVITGCVTAVVTIATYAASIRVPTAPLITLAPVVLGIVGMGIHGCIAARRDPPSDQPLE